MTEKRKDGPGGRTVHTGRTTQSAGAPGARSHKAAPPPPSARYTPPIPREQKVGARWVPFVMFALLALGMLMIVCNYLNLLPGEDPSNWYLLGGLGLITAGFIVATGWR